MTVKMIDATQLLGILTLLTGVYSLGPQVLHVQAGEMVVLQCNDIRYNDRDAKLLWTLHTTRGENLTDLSPSAEQSQMGVLIHGLDLVILRASANHDGNYSCSHGNASRQFRLEVYTPESKEHDKRITYPSTCQEPKACTLLCPSAIDHTSLMALNITSNGVMWEKEGGSVPKNGYFASVDMKDEGFYTCTRSYLYHGQILNMTFTVQLFVLPQKRTGTSRILAPHHNDVFRVDLDSEVVIDCEAVGYSNFDEVFWLSGESFVETNSSLPVYYSLTQEESTDDIKMKASLVFKKVSKEDLSQPYTCKLESALQSSNFVTITLTQKARPVILPLVLCFAGIMVVIILSVAVYMKRKQNRRSTSLHMEQGSIIRGLSASSRGTSA
ncbi:uncharacterized protein LOC125005020 [Mugil cephalus]|uniref:uncharacterized protein LOC125005020 n=1 Tax=Mugil cephalus TaxID=48193 RepID=UPI001FB84AD6|nr:uncharacterized protein LOC125005020 [Mugil cephalus]